MLMTVPQETAAPVVLSRQPIFDCFERVVGYELLTPISGDPAEATAGVLSRALLDMGHQRLAGHVPMHVDVSRDFLLGVRPLPFSPEEVVLEVAGDQAADAALVQALLAASAAGFRITLDGFGTDALLDLAHAVKLDVARAHQDELAALVNVAHDRGLSVIAGGVHTRRAASPRAGRRPSAATSASTPSRAASSPSRRSSPAPPRRPSVCARSGCSPTTPRSRSSSGSSARTRVPASGSRATRPRPSSPPAAVSPRCARR